MTLTEYFFFKGNSIQVDKLINFQCLRSQILLWMARFDKDAALERFSEAFTADENFRIVQNQNLAFEMSYTTLCA